MDQERAYYSLRDEVVVTDRFARLRWRLTNQSWSTLLSSRSQQQSDVHLGSVLMPRPLSDKHAIPDGE